MNMLTFKCGKKLFYLQLSLFPKHIIWKETMVELKCMRSFTYECEGQIYQSDTQICNESQKYQN